MNRIICLPWLMTFASAIASGAEVPPPASMPRTASPGRPTLVILPPTIAGEESQRSRIELLCDRLAERLGKGAPGLPDVAVVDRSQIDRVLAEQGAAAQLKPVLAYDAMLRVELDRGSKPPQVRLTIIDLSLGNVAASKSYALGKIDQGAELDDMARLCRSALAATTTRPAAAGLKVRFVHAVVVGQVPRLQPLAEQLDETFGAALARSPKLCLVRHFEAATAKEESLLLLLGLSKLPGGRQFAPHADATLELRLAELDAVGKTFEQTVLGIEHRLERNGQPGQWAANRGPRAQWDQLLAKAWEALAKELSQANPQAAAEFLNEMAVRRRQAAAEVEKLRNLNATAFSDVGCDPRHGYPPRREEIAAIANAAAKLDPTNEEAVYVAMKFNFYLRRQEVKAAPERLRPLYRQSLLECLRFMANFPGNEEWRHETACVAEAAYHALLRHRWSGLVPYGSSRAGEAPVALEPDLLELVVKAFEVVQRSRTNGCGWGDAECIKAIWESMLVSGWSKDAARTWRDRQLELLARKLMPIAKPRLVPGHYHNQPLMMTRCMQAQCALDEGQPQRAKELLLSYMKDEVLDAKRYSGNTLDVRLYASQPLRTIAERLKDPEVNARLQEWEKGKAGSPPAMTPLAITWPASPVTQGLKPVPVSAKRMNPSPPAGAAWKFAPGVAHVGERRAYFITLPFDPAPLADGDAYAWHKTEGLFGYIDLDESGRPTSDTLVLLPTPPRLPIRSFSDLGYVSAAMVAGRLCVGTYTGLLVFNPADNTWAAYSPEQGLPGRTVYQIAALGDDMALCGGASYRWWVTFSLDLKTGKTTLLRQNEQERQDGFSSAWRLDGRWAGISSRGIVEDLLAPELRVRPWPEDLASGGWGAKYSPDSPGGGGNPYTAGDTALCGRRRFAVLCDGVWEISEQGAVVNHWPADTQITLGRMPLRVPRECYFYRDLPLPGIIPGSWLIGADERYLFLCTTIGMLIFEPAADTWYGPVGPREARPYSARTSHWLTRDHVWYLGLGTTNGINDITGLNYIAKADLIAAARQAGRVATTAELKARLAAGTAQASKLEQAKFAYALHQLPDARRLASEAMKEKPGAPEALIVLGLAHEKDPGGDARQALACYARLSAMPDNPSANLAGDFLQLDLIRRNDLPGALKLGEEILAKYERMTPAWRTGVEGLNDNTRVRMRPATQPATAPAPSTAATGKSAAAMK